MSMFPHTVTVYNTETEELSENDFEPTLVNHITVLRAYYWTPPRAPT